LDFCPVWLETGKIKPEKVRYQVLLEAKSPNKPYILSGAHGRGFGTMNRITGFFYIPVVFVFLKNAGKHNINPIFL